MRSDWLQHVFHEKAFYSVGETMPVQVFQLLCTIARDQKFVPASNMQPRGDVDIEISRFSIGHGGALGCLAMLQSRRRCMFTRLRRESSWLMRWLWRSGTLFIQACGDGAQAER